MDMSKIKKTSELNRKLYTPQVENFKNTQNHFYQYFNMKTEQTGSSSPQTRKISFVNSLKVKEHCRVSNETSGTNDKTGHSRQALSIKPTGQNNKSQMVVEKGKLFATNTESTINKISLRRLVDQKLISTKPSTLTRANPEEKPSKNVFKTVMGKATPILQKKIRPPFFKHKPSPRAYVGVNETIYDRLGFYNSSKNGQNSTKTFSKTFRDNKENIVTTNNIKTEVDEASQVSVAASKRYGLMFSNFFKKKEEVSRDVRISRLETESSSTVFLKFDERSDFDCLIAFHAYLKDLKHQVSVIEDKNLQLTPLFDLINKDALAVFISRVNVQDMTGEELVTFLKISVLFLIILVGARINKKAKSEFANVFALTHQIFEYLLYYLYDFIGTKKGSKGADHYIRWIRSIKLNDKFKMQEASIQNLKNLIQNLGFEVDRCIKLTFDNDKQPIICQLIRETDKLSFGDCILKATEVYEGLFCNFLLSESTVSLSTHIDPGMSMTNIYDDDDEPYFIVQPLEIKSYLPTKNTESPEYTLVLDLDETLVHFQETDAGGQFVVRPFAQEFLELMSGSFELVVFTAAVQEYADWILDRIDTKKLIKHRLYRHHTMCQDNVYIKDLSKLGRELSKTIIVDNNSENFKLQPENGIYIKSWYDNPQDKALRQLSKVLLKLADERPSDLRVALQSLQRKIQNGPK